MSQLRTHQRIYRQHEREKIAERLEEAEDALKGLSENVPMNSERAINIERGIKGEIRNCVGLLDALDRRVERLS